MESPSSRSSSRVELRSVKETALSDRLWDGRSRPALRAQREPNGLGRWLFGDLPNELAP